MSTVAELLAELEGADAEVLRKRMREQCVADSEPEKPVTSIECPHCHTVNVCRAGSPAPEQCYSCGGKVAENEWLCLVV